MRKKPKVVNGLMVVLLRSRLEVTPIRSSLRERGGRVELYRFAYRTVGLVPVPIPVYVYMCDMCMIG